MQPVSDGGQGTGNDDLLTVGDIAGRLKVSEETVRSWLRNNQMRGYNLGGQSGWRVPESEVNNFLTRKLGKRPPTGSSTR